jgi:hypothetical protein
MSYKKNPEIQSFRLASFIRPQSSPKNSIEGIGQAAFNIRVDGFDEEIEGYCGYDFHEPNLSVSPDCMFNGRYAEISEDNDFSWKLAQTVFDELRKLVDTDHDRILKSTRYIDEEEYMEVFA